MPHPRLYNAIMGKDDFRDRLVSRGAEVLADALLDLVGTSDGAEQAVLRMISTRDENLQQFERGIRKVRALKRSRKFFDWRRTGELNGVLKGLLRDLEEAHVDPRNGVKKVVRFFGIGPAAMESCDDSSGIVSGIFRYDATELLAKFARECDDSEWLEEITISLHRDNDYGLNDNVIDTASAFLPERSLQRLIERCWALAESEADGRESRTWLMAIESLAKQRRDPFLFERVKRHRRDQLSTHDFVEIAEVYLLSSRPVEALSWLARVPEDDTRFDGRRDQLMIDAHLELGARDAAAEVAEKIEAWNGVPNHECFSQSLRERHRLKRSFWGRYEEA